MKRSKITLRYLVVALLIVPSMSLLSACQSSPTINKYTAENLYRNDLYLGCISAYTYWQIKLNDGSKFGAANSFCKNQRSLIEGARQKKKFTPIKK